MYFYNIKLLDLNFLKKNWQYQMGKFKLFIEKTLTHFGMSPLILMSP